MPTMKNEKAMQEVIAVLERYFEAAQPDGNYNISIIKKDIERYGEVLIPMSLAYVVHHLRQIARNTVMTFMADEALGDMFIAMTGMKLIANAQSIIMAFGERGIWKLIEVLRYTDEDTAALAAFCLASQQFVRKSSVPYLKSAFQNAEGTGYEIALAYALYEHGDKAPFQVLSKQYRRIDPMVDPMNLFALIVLDMATDGLAPKSLGLRPWKRKQYRE
jgi:hypothetical protein